jgi:hypothetical protein
MADNISNRRGVPCDIDRRRNRRVRAVFDAHLVLDITFLDADAGGGIERRLDFFGSTRDLSMDGVGIVLPAIRLDDRTCAERRAVKVTFHLPRGPVEAIAEAVYCGPLDHGRPGDGSILGARFTDLGEDVRSFISARIE